MFIEKYKRFSFLQNNGLNIQGESLQCKYFMLLYLSKESTVKYNV